jgi:excisionase family DNA binding protein
MEGISMNDIEILLDVQELCTRFKVARSTVYGWIHQGYIPHVHLGAAVRFKPSTIQQWLVQQEQAGRAERVPEVQV